MKLLEKFLESQIIDLILYTSIILMAILVDAILVIIFYRLVF